MKKIQIEYAGRGPLMNDEDWYYLLVHEDGTFEVEHEWDHMNPYKGIVKSRGATSYPLGEFLKTQDGMRLSGKINKIIEELG